MPLTGVPRCVSHCLRGLKPWFRPRHQLVFSWLLVLPLVYGERANLKALARHGPVPLTYRHSRRLLRAASWGTTTLLWWFVDQALQAFPPPEEGTRYGLGDRTLNGKRGARHPVAQRTRLSHRHPSGFGVRRVLLGARWGVYRLPVAFAWLRRKDAADYQTEDALFRQMPRDFRPPGGCQEVVVAAAAYACRPHMALIQERGYWQVLALPRTWKSTTGKPLQALVTQRPRWWQPRICIPTIHGQRRRTFWVDAKQVRLRHLGDVTVVLSTCRRNEGPRHTKILATNLPAAVSARQVVASSLRRWWVELRVKALKGGVGMGQHQVTKETGRVDRSVAGAIMADWLLLRLRAQDIPADRPCSAFRLQRTFAWEVIQGQCERSPHQMARKWLPLGKAA